MRVIALLSLCVACSHTETLDLHGELQISSALGVDIENVEYSANEWHIATGGSVALELSVVDSGANVASGALGGSLGQWHHGKLTLDTQRIRDVSRESGVDYGLIVRATVLHELGHAFGLGHLQTGIMRAANPPSESSDRVDSSALEAFKSLDCARGLF